MRSIDCHHPPWAKRRMPSGLVVCTVCSGSNNPGPFEASEDSIDTGYDDGQTLF